MASGRAIEHCKMPRDEDKLRELLKVKEKQNEQEKQLTLKILKG
jgi:hypothetical protein